MKIILRKDFEHLGNAGDIKEVKNGYARNFLIPQGIAYNATPSNIRAFEEVKNEAKRLGTEVDGSEIVGLVPLEALVQAGRFYSEGKVNTEEELVDLAIDKLGLSNLNPFDKKQKIIDYMI